jgi:hypothetical protein
VARLFSLSKEVIFYKKRKRSIDRVGIAARKWLIAVGLLEGGNSY